MIYDKPLLKEWPIYLLLLIGPLIAYSNVYGHLYLLDDEFLLQKNTLIHSWSSIVDIFRLSSTGGAGGIDSFYRPMQILFYLIVNQIFGFSTESFHALNIFLHLCNTLLFYKLGRRLGFEKWPVALVVLYWSVHPIHTEAVTYMSATADPLHVLFGLLALNIFNRDLAAKSVLWSLPFFILALLSKEPAIVLPALFCICIYLTNLKVLNFRPYLKTWPLWVTAIVYFILRRVFFDSNQMVQFYKTANVYTESILVRIYTFLATLPYYFKLMFWPRDLHLERAFSVHTDWSGPVIVGAIILLLSLSLIYVERHQARKSYSFGVLWALLAHSPQSGVLIPVNAFFLEHWMYWTTMGPLLSISQILSKSVKWWTVVILPACIGLIFLTWQQNKNWADPITFYNYILKVEPLPPARVYNNLGMAYSDIKNYPLAKKNYEKAIEISDVYPQTRHNLALALLAQNEVDQALVNFERAIALDKNFYHSYKYISDIYKYKKNDLKAQEYLLQYIEIRKRFGL